MSSKSKCFTKLSKCIKQPANIHYHFRVMYINKTHFTNSYVKCHISFNSVLVI